MYINPRTAMARNQEPEQANHYSKAYGAFAQLPVFLLPSFRFPLRKRKSAADAIDRQTNANNDVAVPAPPAPVRTSSTSTASSMPSSSYQSSVEVPSLSSSPTSSLSIPSPTSPTYYAQFYDPFAKTPFDAATPTNAPLSATPAELPISPIKQASTTSAKPRLTRLAPDTLRCLSCSADVAYNSQIVSKGFTGRHGRAYLVSAPLPRSTPSCPGVPTSAFESALLDAGMPSRTTTPHEGNLVNIMVGRPENRQLVTGMHVVADISCSVCASKLGWKYVDAKEQGQKYKVGKFILETMRVGGSRAWEDAEGDEVDLDCIRETGFWRRFMYGGGKGRKTNGGEADSVEARASGETVASASSAGSNDLDVVEDEEDIEFDSEDEDECEDIFAGVWNAKEVAARRREKAAKLRGKRVA
jgi:hypothetical protein